MAAEFEVDLKLKESALAFTSCGVTLADARLPDFPLIYANDAFERLSGYEEAEVLGRNCRFLQRHDREQTAIEDLRAALRTGNPCQAVLRNYRKDGSLFWNELMVSPILDRNQEITHFVGIQTDVTASQREKQLRESMVAELQMINKDLDSFAHIVSHDLRAPLRGVGKLCQLLVEQHQSGLDSEGQRLVELMRSRIKRMTGLLEGVLRYSRSRGDPPRWMEVETSNLVREIGEMLALPETIDLRISSDMPRIQCDAIRLGQVFQNLIDNAAKFQQGKGWIAVRGGETKEGWCFSVADNGPGIEPEHQQRIFGIFQTVYSRDQFETTGVGLAVVRKAVERMGGRVWVESEPGSGSTFHFTLAKTQPLVTKMDASLS